MEVDYDPEYNGIELVTVKAADLSKLHAQLSAYKGRIKNLTPELNGRSVVSYNQILAENKVLKEDLCSSRTTCDTLRLGKSYAERKVKELEAEIVKLKADLYDKKFGEA